MFRLLRYFSLISLLSIAVVTALLAFFSRQIALSDLTETGERYNVALTHSLANLIWPQFGPFLTSTAELSDDALRSHAQIAEIKQSLSQAVKGLSVLRINIYDLNGRTVFSSDAKQIGANKSNNAGFVSARLGAVASEFTHRDSFSAFEGVSENRDLISSYIAVRPDGASGRIEGVFELYYDVTGGLDKMKWTQIKLIAGVVLLLGLLYGVLFFIVRHAERAMKRQAGERISAEARLAALRDIGIAITATLDLRSVLNILMGKIDVLVPHVAIAAAQVWLLNWQSGQLERASSWNFDEVDWKAKLVGSGPPLVKEAMTSGQPVIALNVQTDPRTMFPDMYRKMGLVSYVGVPMVIQQQALGVLVFLTKEERRFSGVEIELLSALASQAAIAIHNSQLFEQSRAAEKALALANQRLEKSLEELSSLYAAMTPLALSGSVNEILTGVIDKLIDATGADAALVRLWDKSSEKFAIPTQKGFPESFITAAKLKGAGSAVDQAFRSGKPVVAADVATDERIKGKAQLQAGFVSCAFLPLKVGSEVRGIVHLASRKLGFFAVEQEGRLMAIVHQMGVAIENRELFDEIRSAKESLEVINQKADEQTRALLRSNTELEQFAYVASHDLQEPLRMITSYSQLLAKRYGNQLGEDAQDYIHFMVDGAKRMQGLIKDLLTYSRVGTQGKPFEAVNFTELVQITLASLQLSIAESGATVTYDELPTAHCDHGQITQLLQNLIGNAIKYRNGQGPEVHVSCQSRGNEWLFSVKDNGIGIEPQYAERVFIIFQRLHTRDEYEGTGIGLAVCKKIVERHGGKIWLESEIGKGTTFYFTIPQVSESSRAIENNHAESRQSLSLDQRENAV